MKKILFVNDERQMGGVCILLEDYLNNIDFKDSKVDLLVLHNNGERLKNIPKEVNIIYGDKYFDVVDLPFKSLLKNGKIIKAMKKAFMSFMIKTGLIEKYIQYARKKLIILNYDVEIAFKDGFCTLFTAFGDSKKKINWVHSDYMVKRFTVDKYKKTFMKCFEKFDTIVALSEDIKKSFVTKYGHEHLISVVNNYLNDKRIIDMSNEIAELDLDKSKLNLVCVRKTLLSKIF